MEAVKCLVILMALVYCVDGRERLGKIFKRQARHREDKAIGGPQVGLIHQSVVRNSFAQPQSQPSAGYAQPSEINVPLSPPAVGQAQYQQAAQQGVQPSYAEQAIAQNQYQPITSQASQPSYAAQLIAQNQYQPISSQSSQPSNAAQLIAQNQYQPISFQPSQPSNAAQLIAQNQYQPISSQSSQPSYSAPPIPQNQYQQPIASAQVQQGQEASYQEITLLQAMKSPIYSQAVKQAYQTSPGMAQPIAMRDDSNKILLRLPSNATRIRANIVDGFSCRGKTYGYYADVRNECQIFHVCYPLRSVFNNDPRVPDVTYEFSFICNEFTRFSQDSLTCAWTMEAVDCNQAELLYSINDHFFKITTPAPTPAPYYPSPNLPGPIPGSNQLTGGYLGSSLP